MFSSCSEKPLNFIKFTIFDMFTNLIISFQGNQRQTGVDANYLGFCWDIKCNISSVPVWLFSGVCEAFRSYKYKILMRQCSCHKAQGSNDQIIPNYQRGCSPNHWAILTEIELPPNLGLIDCFLFNCMSVI